MEQLTNLVREFCATIVRLFHSLLIFLLLTLVVGGYLLYRLATWLVENPAIILLPPAALMLVWLLKRYVLGRELAIGKTTAVIVKRADGKLESLYRGWHKLRLGDRVCETLSLRPEAVETNQEEILTDDGAGVRLSASYELQVFNPLRYYLRGRKRRIDFAGLHQESRLAVVTELSFDDLYNMPFEINRHIEHFFNEQLHSYGLQINNYRLAELICPCTNEQWQHNHAPPFGEYWCAAASIKRRLS